MQRASTEPAIAGDHLVQEVGDLRSAWRIKDTPVVMLFANSSNGLSHCKEEETSIEHLDKTIQSFLLLADKTIASVK